MDLPFTTLLSGTPINTKVFFQFLSYESPPLSAILSNQLLNSFILLENTDTINKHRSLMGGIIL